MGLSDWNQRQLDIKSGQELDRREIGRKKCPHCEGAERTVRAWHKAALVMRDLAIKGDCDAIEDLYFDTAMRLPFYGADPDPLPSERMKP